jgi:hypothetical protein
MPVQAASRPGRICQSYSTADSAWPVVGDSLIAPGALSCVLETLGQRWSSRASQESAPGAKNGLVRSQRLPNRRGR